MVGFFIRKRLHLNDKKNANELIRGKSVVVIIFTLILKK